MNVKVDQINAQDAAAMIGCKVSKVYSLARSGELDSINVGLGNKRPRYMFNKSDIDRYIRQHSSLYTQSVVNSQKTPEEYERIIREKEQEIHDLREALWGIKRNLELQVVDIASKVM